MLIKIGLRQDAFTILLRIAQSLIGKDIGGVLRQSTADTKQHKRTEQKHNALLHG